MASAAAPPAVLTSIGGHGVGFLGAVDRLRDDNRLVVHRVDEDQEEAAGQWLRRHEPRRYSFVDATSFRVMRDRRLREALAFDQDSAAAGFVEATRVSPTLGHTRRVNTPRRPTAAVALLLTFALAAACGDDSGPSAGADATTEPPSTTTAADAPFENPYAGHTSDVYDDDGVWLCRPDLTDDVCDSGLDATEVEPDGSLTPVPFEAAVAPAFDCFYVYPTIDYSPEPGNHPFDVPNPLEPVTVQGQAGRFGSLCDLYVPRYRQATIASYPRDGSDIFEHEEFNEAYADVLDAFEYYLATWNEGRPFVLLGHSQGTHHLIRLLQEEFDDSPALRGRLISALLIGPTGRLRVPDGEVVGGTYDNLPLCTAVDETGCIVAFDSYADSEPPTSSTSNDEGVTPCVDPAALVDGDDRLTAGYFGRTVPGVTTLFEVVPDYYTATCVRAEDGGSYLSIAADPAPGDRRDLTHLDDATEASDSLHVLDYNFSLGDLLAIVEAQAAAYEAS